MQSNEWVKVSMDLLDQLNNEVFSLMAQCDSDITLLALLVWSSNLGLEQNCNLGLGA